MRLCGERGARRIARGVTTRSASGERVLMCWGSAPVVRPRALHNSNQRQSVCFEEAFILSTGKTHFTEYSCTPPKPQED